MKRRTFIRTAAYASAGVAAASFAAPAVAQGRVRWKLITAWPKNFPAIGTGTQRIADSIREMSDGRLEVKVYGGGVVAQANAIRHGISRALLQADPSLKKSLREHGLLTRDSRVKESKKYGLKRARRAPQYTKR